MQVHAIQAVSEPKATLPSRNYFATNGQVMSLQEHEAWLEHAGEQRRLEGNCSIGRAGLNTIVVDSPKVSRLHSIIHLEENGAFWLIDLGSSDGTFHNRRRIHDPSDFVIGMRLILAAQHSYSISRAANRRPKSKVHR